MMPRMTGLLVILASHSMAPVSPIRVQKTAVKMPDPQIMPWVMPAGLAMAAPPIAFIGCTGIGVLNSRPT